MIVGCGVSVYIFNMRTSQLLFIRPTMLPSLAPLSYPVPIDDGNELMPLRNWCECHEDIQILLTLLITRRKRMNTVGILVGLLLCNVMKNCGLKRTTGNGKDILRVVVVVVVALRFWCFHHPSLYSNSTLSTDLWVLGLWIGCCHHVLLHFCKVMNVSVDSWNFLFVRALWWSVL
jgi:hypothetical protein